MVSDELKLARDSLERLPERTNHDHRAVPGNDDGVAAAPHDLRGRPGLALAPQIKLGQRACKVRRCDPELALGGGGRREEGEKATIWGGDDVEERTSIHTLPNPSALC